MGLGKMGKTAEIDLTKLWIGGILNNEESKF